MAETGQQCIVATSTTLDRLSPHKLLLEWLNDTLLSDYKKIEDLSNGAAYSQLMDLLFPGSVPLEKVKFRTKLEHESKENFRLVLEAFKKVGCDKEFPFNRLVKSRFQDNFEFLQWFKKFFDANYDGHEYNALEARGNLCLSNCDDENINELINSENGTNQDMQLIVARENKPIEKHDVLNEKPLVSGDAKITYGFVNSENNRNQSLQVAIVRKAQDENELDEELDFNVSLINHPWSRRILELVGNKARLMESFSWLSTVGGGFSALGEKDDKFSYKAGALSLGQQLHLAELLGDDRLKVMCHLFTALAAVQLDNKHFCLNYIRRVIIPLMKKLPYRDMILTNILRHILFRLSALERLAIVNAI